MLRAQTRTVAVFSVAEANGRQVVRILQEIINVLFAHGEQNREWCLWEIFSFYCSVNKAKLSHWNLADLYWQSHSCSHIHGLSCCLLLQFKENRSSFVFSRKRCVLAVSSQAVYPCSCVDVAMLEHSHRAWKSHQSHTVCWFVFSSPPDEANENESSGSLNNQLSWKQGRQLLRQWAKVFYSIWIPELN